MQSFLRYTQTAKKLYWQLRSFLRYKQTQKNKQGIDDSLLACFLSLEFVQDKIKIKRKKTLKMASSGIFSYNALS